jgi:phosphoribosyl 1,2-cyclic phosphodiesterase
MLIRFWGTRGSLPAPLNYQAVRTKIRTALIAACGKSLDNPEAIDRFIDGALPFSVSGTFGGNTSCVEIVSGGDEYVLCDMGSGAREFGNSVLAKYGPAKKNHYNIFMSHVHWDHVMGFPFFTPSYIPGNVIRIYGCHKNMREAFERQQSNPSFPVDFKTLGATIEFIQIDPGRTYEIDGLSVRAIVQSHGGDSYGYRFSKDGRTLVYSTDSEHKYEALNQHYPFIEFFRDADLVIFDAQYSLADQVSVKEDWGHSSNMIGVELAQLAGARHLVMYHHEPVNDDKTLEKILAETQRYEEISRSESKKKLTISSAYDGLEIVI